MTAPELFDIPPSLSPLRQFVQDYDVRRADRPEEDPEERWCAWFASSQRDPDKIPDVEMCGFGATEEEAIEHLATVWGWLKIGHDDRVPVRVCVLWCVGRKADGSDDLQWLKATLLMRHPDGRCYVRTDCGKVCQEAAPECVYPCATQGGVALRLHREAIQKGGAR